MSKVGIETVTVDSSLVSVMTYARKAKMLYVTFKNGTIYLYNNVCLLYTSPSPRDVEESRMPSSA